MRYEKRKRGVATWKVIRRCVVFFTAICVIPVLLVLLVTTDQYMRPSRNIGSINFYKPDIGHWNNKFSMNKNMSMVDARYTERREYFKRMCSEMGLDVLGNDTLHKPNSWEYLINREHRLVWCNVFKAGSSSWMYNFNILAGYNPSFLKKTKQVPLHLARLRYPRPSLDELRKAFETSISFMIVRHPLERLLSGYKDKIQHSLPYTYHQKLGNQIIHKYRNKTADTSVRKLRYPTFEEFVRFLLDSYKNGKQLDMHWTPITEFCTPCMFNFKYIAHMETLQEDQEFIIKKARIDHLIKAEWKNAGRGRLEPEKYFSQLTRSQILQLYHIYRYDFEVFNYTLDNYLPLAQIDKDPMKLLAAISMKDGPDLQKSV